MNRSHRISYYAATALLALLAAEVILFSSHLHDHQADMVAGWTAAFLLHVLGLRLFDASIGKPVDRFLLYALGGMIIRLFVLIIFLITVLICALFETVPFLIGLLTTYLIGSWREIAWLAGRTAAKPDNH